MTSSAIAENELQTPLGSSGVLTSRLLEEFAAFQGHPFRDQIIALLKHAEKEIFIPLLTCTTPSNFAQQFEYLAWKYTPIRLAVMTWLAKGIGPDFKNLYFQAAFDAKARLVANAWGVSRQEITLAFDQYLTTAKTLVWVLPKLAAVPPIAVPQVIDQITKVIGPITEVDFGFTSLALAFEGEIRTAEWVLTETFNRTHRALLDYDQLAAGIIAQVDDPAQMEAVLCALRPETEVEQPTPHDLKSSYRRYDPQR